MNAAGAVNAQAWQPDAQALRRWLFGSAYELWWRRGADPRGGFHERLALDGTPVDEPRRLRVQARQTHVFAEAARLGWSGPAPTAVAHGLDFLLRHYRRADGLFRTRVAVDGRPVDDTVVLYDHAFVLLALAAGFARGQGEARAVAHELHDRLRAGFGNVAGGLFESPLRSAPLTSNSHMHLLEASLAWLVLDDDPRWMRLAAEIVELALTRFIDAQSGALREFFDANWQPAAGAAGTLVEPGHQFEWAFLLLSYAERVPDARIRPAALRLVEIGERHGVDPARGVAINALDDDFRVRDGQARLWPQTERIRAAVVAAGAGGDAGALHAATAAACGALRRYLELPVQGLWRDRMLEDGSFIDEPAPGSSLYHIAGAVAELMRSAGWHGPGD